MNPQETLFANLTRLRITDVLIYAQSPTCSDQSICSCARCSKWLILLATNC